MIVSITRVNSRPSLSFIPHSQSTLVGSLSSIARNLSIDTAYQCYSVVKDTITTFPRRPLVASAVFAFSHRTKWQAVCTAVTTSGYFKPLFSDSAAQPMELGGSSILAGKVVQRLL